MSWRWLKVPWLLFQTWMVSSLFQSTVAFWASM